MLYRVDVHDIDQKKNNPKEHDFSSIKSAMDFISKLIQNKKLALFLYKNDQFKASFSYKLKMIRQAKNKKLKQKRGL